MEFQLSLFGLPIETIFDKIANISRKHSSNLDPSHKLKYSQFFTEQNLARQMSKMISITDGAHVGDHGAGTGILGAFVLADKIRSQKIGVKPLTLTAYEIDELLHEAFHHTLSIVSDYAKEKGHKGPATSLHGDFTAIAQEIIEGKHRTLDSAIINPPYQKLNQQTPLAKLMRSELVVTPNLYAVFMSLTILMLKDGGEMVAIVPRSFTSGTYFKPFRKWLKAHGSIDHIVRYQCRSNLFRNDNVLQENVILKFTRGLKQTPQVKVSICESPDCPPTFESYVSSKIIFPELTDIFYVPGGQDELSALEIMSGMPVSFSDLGITISTGKFEDFRQRDSLSHEEPLVPWAPVVYSQHWERASTKISWPKIEINKPQYAALNTKTIPKILPRGNYVLIKRISANDSRTDRCSPAILLEDSALHGDQWAIDNHIQIVNSSDGTTLTKPFTVALANYLGTEKVNSFLKSVSGTTQLNVADLEQIRYPNSLLALRYEIS